MTTHKHHDHAGGNLDILKQYSVKVYGGEFDNIPGVTNKVRDKEEFILQNGLKVKVLHTPCHTLGHV